MLLLPAFVVGVLAVRDLPRRPSSLETATVTALGCAAGAAFLIALLGWVVSGHNAVVDLDHDIASWAADHGGHFEHRVVRAVTRLGASDVARVLLVVVGVVQLVRKPSVWLALFVGAVWLGDAVLVREIKDLVGRARPDVSAAATLVDPSFPSGHTTNAAACYAAVALLLGVGCSRTTRATLLGIAVGIAVAVAASRVLLTVHWFTGVVAGLALGWGWCALCAAAFGRTLFAPAGGVATTARAGKSPPPGKMER